MFPVTQAAGRAKVSGEERSGERGAGEEGGREGGREGQAPDLLGVVQTRPQTPRACRQAQGGAPQQRIPFPQPMQPHRGMGRRGEFGGHFGEVRRPGHFNRGEVVGRQLPTFPQTWGTARVVFGTPSSWREAGAERASDPSNQKTLKGLGSAPRAAESPARKAAAGSLQAADGALQASEHAHARFRHDCLAPEARGSRSSQWLQFPVYFFKKGGLVNRAHVQSPLSSVGRAQDF